MEGHGRPAGNLTGILLAAFLYIPILFLPGYAFGWAANLLEFRNRTPLCRAALALVLSISIVPILIYWLPPMLLVVCGLVTTALGICVFRWPRFSYLYPALWVGLVLFALTDWQWGDHLFLSVITFDHSLRAVITEAITRTGIPPVNPFNALGGPIPLRYHYFWPAVNSAAQRLGGPWGNARDAVRASTIWCAFGLASLVVLYLRFFDSKGAEGIQRRSFWGVILLFVTGLDILPNAVYWIFRAPPAEMEWWNDQVTSWVGSVLWVPHNIAALIAVMTGFLLIWCAKRENRLANVLFASLAFASATGLSVFVSVAFAISATAWMFILMVRRQKTQLVLLFCAGSIATLVSLPFLRSLTSGPPGEVSLFSLTVRDFGPLHYLSSNGYFLRLAVLPLNYTLELGFFLVAAILVLRRRPSLPHELAALTMGGTAFFVCTFIRSGSDNENDFGWRGFLLVQFFLLLWAVEFFPLRKNSLLAIFFWLGLSGTFYEIAINRFFIPLEQAGIVERNLSPDLRTSRRALAARAFYNKLHATLPPGTIAQTNPVRGVMENVAFRQYGLFPTAAAGPSCGTEFGGDPRLCASELFTLQSLFNGTITDPFVVKAISRGHSIDLLVVADTDPEWKKPGSWIWNEKPFLADDYARAFYWK